MASSGDTSASNYSRSILRVAIAQLCDEIGWQAVEGTALNILVDILEKYILSAGRSTKMWLEHGMGLQGEWVNIAQHLTGANSNALSEISCFFTDQDCPRFAHPSFEYPCKPQSPMKMNADIAKTLSCRSSSESANEDNSSAEAENEEKPELPALSVGKRKHSTVDSEVAAEVPVKKEKKSKKEKKKKKDAIEAGEVPKVKKKKHKKEKDLPEDRAVMPEERTVKTEDQTVMPLTLVSAPASLVTIPTPHPVRVPAPVEVRPEVRKAEKKAKKKKKKSEKTKEEVKPPPLKLSISLGKRKVKDVAKPEVDSSAPAHEASGEAAEKLYICPACKQLDDGIRAMVSCEVCSSDIWYHMECVGYNPITGLDWICPDCRRAR